MWISTTASCWVVHHFSPLITAIRHREYRLPTLLSTGKHNVWAKLPGQAHRHPRHLVVNPGLDTSGWAGADLPNISWRPVHLLSPLVRLGEPASRADVVASPYLGLVVGGAAEVLVDGEEVDVGAMR